MCALKVKSQMPHEISSHSFFIKLISILSILEWQNRILFILPLFRKNASINKIKVGP